MINIPDERSSRPAADLSISGILPPEVGPNRTACHARFRLNQKAGRRVRCSSLGKSLVHQLPDVRFEGSLQELRQARRQRRAGRKTYQIRSRRLPSPTKCQRPAPRRKPRAPARLWRKAHQLPVAVTAKTQRFAAGCATGSLGPPLPTAAIRIIPQNGPVLPLLIPEEGLEVDRIPPRGLSLRCASSCLSGHVAAGPPESSSRMGQSGR